MKNCAQCGQPLVGVAAACPVCGAAVVGAKPPPPPPRKIGPPPPPKPPAAPPPAAPPAPNISSPATTASPPSTSPPAPKPAVSAPAKPVKPPSPGPVKLGPVDGKLDELQRQALALERSVKRQRFGSWLLGFGSLAAILLALFAAAAYHRATVMSYAELADDLSLDRDAADPERLTIKFQPVSPGRVGFRRRDENRDTELLDRVAPSDNAESLQWRWSGVRPGDVVKVQFRKGWSLKTRELTVSAPPAQAPLGDARVHGEVVSATTGEAVSGALVRLTGTPLKATTDGAGKFQIDAAPAGPVSVEISAPGYSTEQLEKELQSGGADPLRVTLSPGLAEGQIRFVVTWGKEPRDLDAHLEGPLPGDKRFHVFHKQKGDLASKEFVSLDVDDRDGDGPETITVLGVQPGRYHYFIHNADAGATDSDQKTALSRSQAEVKIYQGGQTYRFHPRPEEAGNLWRVCDLVIDAQGKATITPINQFEFTTQEQEGLYAKRTQANREQWIVNYGGTPASEAAVNAGLDWLARHQASDGHWGPDCLHTHANSRCEGVPKCDGAGSDHSVAQTGLAVLAFQAGGHFHDNNHKYSDNVRRALDWLVAQQQADGLLQAKKKGSRSGPYMYEHGIGAFAVSEASAIAVATQRAAEPRYRDAAERAIRYIERIQHNDGGWRYTESKSERGDMSVTGWQVLALKNAKEAHIDVSDVCIAGVDRFLTSCRIARTGRTSYLPNSGAGSDAMAGVGMLVEQLLLNRPDSEYVVLGGEYLVKAVEGQGALAKAGAGKKRQDRQAANYYMLYNCTLAMFQRGGQPWKRWNDVVRDRVIQLQDDGANCSRGSWDPATERSGGRICSTALAILTLEVYYRYNSEKAKVY